MNTNTQGETPMTPKITRNGEFIWTGRVINKPGLKGANAYDVVGIDGWPIAASVTPTRTGWEASISGTVIGHAKHKTTAQIMVEKHLETA